MKTIRQHFESLPEPYRSQAIANTRPMLLDTTENTVWESLSSAFIWANTSQGMLYWSSLYAYLDQNNLSELTPEQIAKFDAEFKEWAETNLED